MKILVTGHKGYIGSRVYNKLREMNYEVTGLDLKDGDDILHCLPEDCYDYVFHLAALPRVGFSVKNPSYTLKQNVLVTSTLLEWAKKKKVKRVIFSSSAAANGNGNSPTSPYGLHKKMSELECKLYAELYDLDTVCLRYFNVYSEDQEYGGSYSTALSAWMEMIRRGEKLRLDGTGEQTRDFIHVDDIVMANIFCMLHASPLNGIYLNVAYGKSYSLNYIKNYIDKKYSVEWYYTESRPGDIVHSTADVAEFRSLGWSPTVSLEQGLERCFDGKKK
jgi:UDP-glucose 4-epimerase